MKAAIIELAIDNVGSSSSESPLAHRNIDRATECRIFYHKVR
jgi:hypothetical protein